jgi:hypothetical protein
MIARFSQSKRADEESGFHSKSALLLVFLRLLFVLRSNSPDCVNERIGDRFSASPPRSAKRFGTSKYLTCGALSLFLKICTSE